MKKRLFVQLRGKRTIVRLLDASFHDDPDSTTAMYFEHDEPLPSLFVKDWNDVADVVAALETKH